MPEERVELSWGCPRRILSPLRLPFRHSGRSPRAKYTQNHAAATEQRVPAAKRRRNVFAKSRDPAALPATWGLVHPSLVLGRSPALLDAPSAARQPAASTAHASAESARAAPG